jgi:purine-binding chemotaxis protein CheW
MEFKKTRERAKEERGRTRPPTSAATSVPTAAPTTAPLPSLAPQATSPPAPARGSMAPTRAARDPLADFLAQYDEGASEAADALDDEPLADDERRFLSFELAGEAYAASIMDIREILKLVALTEVPRAPKEVLGVLSKRGVVMPVVDLASLLGLRSSERAVVSEQRVLVVSDHDRIVGLRVDRVRQVVRLSARSIEEVPPSLGSKNAHMLLGLGRTRADAGDHAQILILLDIDAVLAQLATAVGIDARAAGTKRSAHA